MAQTAENPITQDPVTAPETPERVADSAEPTTPAARGRLTGARTRPPGTTSASRRRTRVELRHVGPLSVLKFSLLFYFCAMLIGFIALFLIFQVLDASGTIETVENRVGCLFQETDRATTGDCVPYEFNGGVVFTWLFLLGCAGTVVVALLNTFIAIVYNLISDIVGGVELTLSERARRA